MVFFAPVELAASAPRGQEAPLGFIGFRALRFGVLGLRFSFRGFRFRAVRFGV